MAKEKKLKTNEKRVNISLFAQGPITKRGYNRQTRKYEPAPENANVCFCFVCAEPYANSKHRAVWGVMHVMQEVGT